jgi:hypothetical protein
MGQQAIAQSSLKQNQQQEHTQSTQPNRQATSPLSLEWQPNIQIFFSRFWFKLLKSITLEIQHQISSNQFQYSYKFEYYLIIYSLYLCDDFCSRSKPS